MTANTPEKLDGINQTLAELNTIIRQMLEKMPGQPGRFRNAMDVALAFVGVLTIVNIMDVIVKWFIGG